MNMAGICENVTDIHVLYKWIEKETKKEKIQKMKQNVSNID